MRPPDHAQPAVSLAVLREIEDAAGCCRQPVRLHGWQTEYDPATCEIISQVSSSDQPGGYLLIPCGNRREAVCPACSRIYKGDTYQVMISGLKGGHGTPGTVSQHPAVFATLTAPGFGPVHRGAGRNGSPPRCMPRRDKPLCRHGQPMSCGRRHHDGDPAIGQPLCPACFDYATAVLFNASVPALWDQTARALPAVLSRELGISRRQLRDTLRISFAKVIEYQHRGLIHVHAVIRLDGPGGPADPAPPWAGTSLLRTAVLTAATVPSVTLPSPADSNATITMTWGRQADVRIVRRDIAGELDACKVAAYIGKYATKGTEDIGGVPRRIRTASDLDAWHVTPHARRMIITCWQPGHRPQYATLNLARWAHQLGYGGHFSTRSRRYPVTLSSRRQERRDTRTTWIREQAGLPASRGATAAEWHYAGTGEPPRIRAS